MFRWKMSTRVRVEAYLSISFRNLSYAGKKSRFPVGAVRVSNMDLPLTISQTNGTSDPNHTKASSSTLGSSLTYIPRRYTN